jgi:peptide/nickel transport system substrate-binding protein
MRKRLFGLAVAALFAFSACGGAASPSPSATSAQSAAPTGSAEASAPAGKIDITIASSKYKPDAVGNTGGKLLFGISGEPTSLWFGAYDNFANNVDAFSPALWNLWSNTGDLKYYGQLATNIPTVDNGGVTMVGDGMDVKIDLVAGAQWSDGQPITCDDVAYMVEWSLDKDQVGLITGKAGWEDITGVDGGTGTNCVVHFKKVYEQYLSLWAPLLPKHYLQTTTVKKAQTTLYTHAKADDVAKGVYSGPYMPVSWTAGSQLDYKPNPKFWETIKKATAPFDDVTFKFYADPQTEIAGYQNGEIDVALEFNHTHLPLMASINPDEIQGEVGVTYEHTSWNFKHMSDNFGADGAKALITALHYLIDKDEINQRVLAGTAEPGCNFVFKDAWWYKDIPCYKVDPDKAKQVLDAAGFTAGADGVREKNGKKVELLACTRADRDYRVNTLRLIGDQVAKAGIKFNLDHVATDRAVLFSSWEGPDAAAPDAPCNLTRGNFDVTEFAWVGTPDPVSIQYQYLSKYDPTEGDHSGQNYIRIKNPDLDTKINSMNTTVDLEKIKTTMGDIEDFYVNPDNAFPEIALYNWKTVLIRNPKMHNIVNNSTAATQSWNIEDWWREQ